MRRTRVISEQQQNHMIVASENRCRAIAKITHLRKRLARVFITCAISGRPSFSTLSPPLWVRPRVALGGRLYRVVLFESAMLCPRRIKSCWCRSCLLEVSLSTDQSSASELNLLVARNVRTRKDRTAISGQREEISEDPQYLSYLNRSCPPQHGV